MNAVESAIQRASEERIRAFKRGPGSYAVPSFTTRGNKPRVQWFAVHAVKRLERIQVICNHPQIMGYRDSRDDFGNSTCKHAVAVAKRLLRQPEEQAAILEQPAPRRLADPFQGL